MEVNVMGKYFIIIYPQRSDDLWRNISRLCTTQGTSPNESYSDGIKVNDFTLFFYQTNDRKESITQQSLQEFFKANNILPNSEIIIFGHKFEPEHPGISEQVLDQIKSNYPNLEYRLFSTANIDEYPCKLIWCLNFSISISIKDSTLNQESFQKSLNSKLEEKSIKFDWETLKKEVEKKSVIEPFSLLKHSIMTSFLDLDIDWQGIKEVNEKDKESAKKYLNDILEKKSENYYCQKLVNLWFYLTGNKDLKIESIHSSLEKDKLPYKKSVLDLINELDNDRKNNLKEKWRNLLSHVGLNVNLNDPNNIEKGKESLIIFYLQNLDLMSQQNKEDKDVNIFLGKFEKKEDSKKEKEIIYFNFHEWYLKLGDLLEELKSFLE
jgi:hypothetical protein